MNVPRATIETWAAPAEEAMPGQKPRDPFEDSRKAVEQIIEAWRAQTERPDSGEGEWLNRVAEKSWEFDFFHLTRKLDVFFGAQKVPRIGYARTRAGEALQFGQRPFQIFAPRTVDSWEPIPPDECAFKRPALMVYFFGLFGPDGPLPSHITDHAAARERQGDFAFTNYANLFQHRFISFYYRAWASARITVDMDRAPSGAPGERKSEARFTRFISSLAGIANAGSRSASADADQWARLHFAGHLIARTRHAEGLEAMLRDYFGVPVSIEQMFGRWMDLPVEMQSRLGTKKNGAVLGQMAVLGKQVWDCQGSMRLRIGPLNIAEFRRLLPGSSGCRQLVEWVAQYTGPAIKWDVQPILRKEFVPELRLGGDPCESRLGLDTFLKSRPAERDVQNVVFDLTRARRASEPQSTPTYGHR